jgi:hypothetical protein
MAPNASAAAEPGPVPSGIIRVENKLYSADKLMELHPGGPLFIAVNTQVLNILPKLYYSQHYFQAFSGRDASQAFIAYHRRSFPHSRVKSAFDSIDETVEYSAEEDHADFMELCDRVAKVLPRLKSWAPWQYYLKVAFYMVSVFLIEGYCHYHAFYWWPISCVVGLFSAWIGEFS